jgi:2-polyprenyl-3-methyl-5-hydroxy-6-metoxy-1,4-benzoquinol methylase
MNNDDYFRLRNISENSYIQFQLPTYLLNILPDDINTRILDIGCGFGQMLRELIKKGYTNTIGVDVSEYAVDSCSKQGLNVQIISSIHHYCVSSAVKYDFILLSHVLEHLDKSEIIPVVELIKTYLLEPGGSMLVIVPNAQSNTGCYWAYEDFTHTTLFTAGSLLYVLKAAGFLVVDFLDPDGLEGSSPAIRVLKKILLSVYKSNISFWNRVTTSYFHKPSPQIFTYELKAIAK